MITANSFGRTGAIVVELTYPNTLITHTATVRNQDEVDRLVRHHKRKYMAEKLQSFLRQRKEAVKASPDGSKIQIIAQLQVIISYHQFASLNAFCAAIAKHRDPLMTVAPGESSKFYNHFTTVILPIIIYCSNAN